MSANNGYLLDLAGARRRESPLKPYAKRMVRRAARRAGHAEIELGLGEVRELGLPHPDNDEAPACLDDLWFHDPDLFKAADEWLDERERAQQEQEETLYQLGAQRELPADLVGGLPDWMLDQIEASNGNAMDYLSLFECKPAVRRAPAILEDDE